MFSWVLHSHRECLWILKYLLYVENFEEPGTNIFINYPNSSRTGAYGYPSAYFIARVFEWIESFRDVSILSLSCDFERNLSRCLWM